MNRYRGCRVSLLVVVLATGWLEAHSEILAMWAVLGAFVPMCVLTLLQVVECLFVFRLPVVLQFAPCVAFLPLLLWRLSR